MTWVLRLAIAATVLAAPIAAIAGPFSKYESRQLEHDYQSRANMYDVERCIIDVDGWPPPLVFRQPDKPDRVTIIWTEDMGAGGRLDLIQRDAMLEVRGWSRVPKAITTCAPPIN
ncbi:MAG: hypothetical protein Q27BB25_04530 [Blastomonas sp. CACIA14H2]|uniref:hypothetical protein n=1 Tax=Blastomonas sp. CACIA14H2 TaxID=1419876 RepID=UPI0003D02867|nr:MAG: hypothetical protein Q27BB25_04530 [Blastomonas sp. CACIA14H2]